MQSELYWLYMQRVLGIASRKVADVINYFGSAEQFYYADISQKRAAKLLSARELERAKDTSLEKEKKVVAQCDSRGYGIITPDSPEYPSRLENLPNPPCVLFIDGRLPEVDDEVLISIVGTRKATDYGVAVTAQLSKRLAEAGAVIVSGGAHGIDTAAHTGAISAGGRTIAVLGCGLGYPYLMENAAMREDIAHSGAVISEFAPGTPPSRYTFPVRNRIISGLSLGTVVVEAGKKSGSLITVNHALEQGRDVFAIPGDLSGRQNIGSNRLIVDGARPVLCPRDILVEYAAIYPHKLDLRGSSDPLEAVPLTADDELTELPAVSDEQLISDSLLSELSPNAAAVYEAMGEISDLEAIVGSTGLSGGDAMVALTELEIARVITALPGGRYKRI